MTTKTRKEEHLDICLKKDVQFTCKTSGFDDIYLGGVELIYKTLPEISKSHIDISTKFLGKKFSAPLMVNAMTGGIKKAEKINKNIAKACQSLGLGMGLGSQRAMLEKPSLAYTYQIRDVAPDIFLAGNIGIAQAREYSLTEITSALKSVDADALAIHLNAAQEAVQPKGDTDFRGALKAISRISSKLKKPVYVKEVGAGISYETAKALAKTKIKAIDVGGAGGTSWTGVEYLRSDDLNRAYWDFGIPTGMSILEVKKATTKPIIASGGIRNGLQVVKSMILGASIAGIALPVLRAQHKEGARGAEKYLSQIIQEIRTGMFMLGSKNTAKLNSCKYILKGESLDWAKQRKLKLRR